MITFKQLKAKILEDRLDEIVMDVADSDELNSNASNRTKDAYTKYKISEAQDELDECNELDDLIYYLSEQGMSKYESQEFIINILMNTNFTNGKTKKKKK